MRIAEWLGASGAAALDTLRTATSEEVQAAANADPGNLRPARRDLEESQVDAAQAHRDLEARAATGSTVLTTGA